MIFISTRLQFSGHAVMPSLARDMIDPTQFDSMIDWAFGIATLIYTTIGVTGYLMFGDNVSDEVSLPFACEVSMI